MATATISASNICENGGRAVRRGGAILWNIDTHSMEEPYIPRDMDEAVFIFEIEYILTKVCK